MRPLRDLLLFYKKLDSIAHFELFEACRAAEILSAPWFLCHENVSSKTVSSFKDMTTTEINHVATHDALALCITSIRNT